MERYGDEVTGLRPRRLRRPRRSGSTRPAGRARGVRAVADLDVGQRERYGVDQVVLVGSGTHRGTVIAGDTWGAPMRRMRVPPARRRSLEDVLHAAAPDRALIVFPRADRPDLLTDTLDHRAIGVVYRPERERLGNYTGVTARAAWRRLREQRPEQVVLPDTGHITGGVSR
jgi:erythromycin esterase-like protein